MVSGKKKTDYLNVQGVWRQKPTISEYDDFSYPPYPNGFSGPCHFCLIIAETDIDVLFLLPIFGLKQPDSREKSFFCLVVRGVYPPYPLFGTTISRQFMPKRLDFIITFCGNKGLNSLKNCRPQKWLKACTPPPCIRP